MTRSVALWVGKTDDAKVPPRVRLRIWRRDKGICFLSGRQIRAGEKWELDHRIALINGGRHAEDNLVVVLAEAHKVKTSLDVAEKAAVDSLTKAHVGIGKSKGTIPSRRGKPQAPKDKLPIPARPPRERFFVKETT